MMKNSPDFLSESAPARGAICYGGYWIDGHRCSDDDECSDGTICLAPRDPHCAFVAPIDDPVECPAGSAGPEVEILCAPGYELTQITRDGCVSCLPENDACLVVEKCRRSDLTFEACLWLCGFPSACCGTVGTG